MNLLCYSILIGLASWRSWRIAALDIITERPRNWLYGKADFNVVAGFFADLIGCVYCLGFWLACVGAWLVSDLMDYGIVEFSLLALAGSAIAGATHKAVDQ